MLHEAHALERLERPFTFEFESVGPKGTIAKVIRYSEINVRGIYNLGFGDKDPETGYISDLIRTDNKDNQKVLATVAQTLYQFTDRYPDAIVIATGSNEARTRLYRMGITNNLQEVEQDFSFAG